MNFLKFKDPKGQIRLIFEVLSKSKKPMSLSEILRADRNIRRTALWNVMRPLSQQGGCVDESFVSVNSRSQSAFMLNERGRRELAAMREREASGQPAHSATRGERP